MQHDANCIATAGKDGRCGVSRVTESGLAPVSMYDVSGTVLKSIA